MRKLADRKLKQDYSQVIAKLSEKARNGDVSSVKLLLEMSDMAPQAQAQKRAGNRFNQAEAWALEPEWRGEANEADAETGSGSREPEG